MAQDTHQPPTESAVQRADFLADQMGRRIGSLAASARVRVQSLVAQSALAAQTAMNSSSQALHSDATSGETSSGANSDAQAGAGEAPPAMERAETLVDEAGERLNQWGHAAGHQLQVIFARLREEGEDIWAEAQTIRRPEQTAH